MLEMLIKKYPNDPLSKSLMLVGAGENIGKAVSQGPLLRAVFRIELYLLINWARKLKQLRCF
jgi:hypothetical protein